MRIQKIKLFDDITAVVVNDYYQDKELSDIMFEIQFIEPKLGDETKTNAASEKTAYGEKRKKRGRGVFLDDVYTDRRFSSILTHSRKLFHNPEIRNHIVELQKNDKDALYWKLWDHINFDSTLLQCYSNGDYYDYHIDRSLFTSISTLKFTDTYIGGNLMFKYEGKEVLYQAEHNSMILFPSMLDHKVTEVLYDSESLNPSTDTVFNKRWSIAHLISIR